MCGCSPGRQTLSQPVSLSERPTANCATICYVPQTEKDWIPNHFRNTWQGHMRRLIKLQIESRRRQKGHGTTETDSWDGECPFHARGRHRCTDHTLAKISLPLQKPIAFWYSQAPRTAFTTYLLRTWRQKSMSSTILPRQKGKPRGKFQQVNFQTLQMIWKETLENSSFDLTVSYFECC